MSKPFLSVEDFLDREYDKKKRRQKRQEKRVRVLNDGVNTRLDEFGVDC